MLVKEQKKRQKVKLNSIPNWLVAVVDVTLVNFAFYLAFTLRFLGNVPEYNIEPFAAMAPWISLCTVILFGGLGLYANQRNGFTPVLRSVVIGVIFITMASVAIAFWIRGFTFPRSVFLIAPVLQLLLMLSWRVLLWRLELWIHGQKKLLVVGHPQEVQQALNKLLFLPRGMFEVIKVLEPDRMEEFDTWLEPADAVMITGSLELELKNRIIRSGFNRGKEAFVVPDLYEILLTRARMTQVHDTPVIQVRDMHPSFPQSLIKRGLDLIVAAMAMVLAAPLLLLVALGVRLTSPGPVIYVQERVGYKGAVFKLYKFRTMVQDAEEASGPVFAMEKDDRVTPLGRFLRVCRMDELPQLVNVLKGDLSLVGPRPERPYFVEQFKQEIPEYDLRALVKPGITGLAQVAGHYSTDTADKLRFDLYYIADYSLLLDIRILALTIPTLFNRDSSRGIGEVDCGRDKPVVVTLRENRFSEK